MSIKHSWVLTDEVSTITLPIISHGLRPHPSAGSRVKPHTNTRRRKEINTTCFLEHTLSKTCVTVKLMNHVSLSTSYQRIISVRSRVGCSVEVRVMVWVFVTPTGFYSYIRSTGLTCCCIAHGYHPKVIVPYVTENCGLISLHSLYCIVWSVWSNPCSFSLCALRLKCSPAHFPHVWLHLRIHWICPWHWSKSHVTITTTLCPFCVISSLAQQKLFRSWTPLS